MNESLQLLPEYEECPISDLNPGDVFQYMYTAFPDLWLKLVSSKAVSRDKLQIVVTFDSMEASLKNQLPEPKKDEKVLAKSVFKPDMLCKRRNIQPDKCMCVKG